MDLLRFSILIGFVSKLIQFAGVTRTANESGPQRGFSFSWNSEEVCRVKRHGGYAADEGGCPQTPAPVFPGTGMTNRPLIFGQPLLEVLARVPVLDRTGETAPQIVDEPHSACLP
jgi:hypothetical protein